MKKASVILALAFCSAPAAAASSAHCDSTPFTLAKPATGIGKSKSDQPGPQAAPTPAKKPQVATIPKKPPAKLGGKQRLLASCKAGKARKKSG